MPAKRKYGRSKRTLSKRSIRKRTGAKSQSRQISALSRKVNRVARDNKEKIVTSWSRNQIPIQSLATSGYPFVCPIPYHCMDPLDQWAPGTGQTTQWRDNLALATQPYYTKGFQFGYSDAAKNSNQIKHTGGTIKWQMASSEPDYSKVSLFLVRAKKNLADQLIDDRTLDGTAGTVPFGPDTACFKIAQDYTMNDATGSASGAPSTYFGATFNKKYWDVLYHREVAFGHPGAQGFAGNASANNSTPKNNALIATGTIRLPPGGVIKSASDGLLQPQNSAIQLGLVDQRNENACFLVAIQNGVTADLEMITMGMLVLDYYEATV